jgi:hypothetical protein
MTGQSYAKSRILAITKGSLHGDQSKFQMEKISPCALVASNFSMPDETLLCCPIHPQAHLQILIDHEYGRKVHICSHCGETVQYFYPDRVSSAELRDVSSDRNNHPNESSSHREMLH